jgi:hypothetical protein
MSSSLPISPSIQIVFVVHTATEAKRQGECADECHDDISPYHFLTTLRQTRCKSTIMILCPISLKNVLILLPLS